MSLIDYTKPIEYVDGTPAKFLETIREGHKYAITPYGLPNSQSGNYYDVSGKHCWNLYMDIQNVLTTVAAGTDEALAKELRSLDDRHYEIFVELEKRGYQIEDTNGFQIDSCKIGRIYTSETVTKEI